MGDKEPINCNYNSNKFFEECIANVLVIEENKDFKEYRTNIKLQNFMEKVGC